MRASSTAKGETVADTARVVASYADVLVVRHYWDGAVQAMAEYADVPVINAGDGARAPRTSRPSATARRKGRTEGPDGRHLRRS